MSESEFFFTGSWPGIVWIRQGLPNFDSNPLTCDSYLFPCKNSPNIANSNHFFPGKGRGDKDFILTYLAEVFLQYCLFISISAIFSRNRGSKLYQKCQLWVHPFSVKTQILQKIFKQWFCLLGYYNHRQNI